MNEHEKKLCFILLDHMHNMAQERTASLPSVSPPKGTIFGLDIGFDWHLFKVMWEDHVCRQLDARITAIRRDLMENFYVINPSDTPFLDKPTMYFEIGKDVGLKALGLGYIP